MARCTLYALTSCRPFELLVLTAEGVGLAAGVPVIENVQKRRYRAVPVPCPLGLSMRRSPQTEQNDSRGRHCVRTIVAKGVVKAELQPQGSRPNGTMLRVSEIVRGNQCVLIKRVASSAVRWPVASAPISFWKRRMASRVNRPKIPSMCP